MVTFCDILHEAKQKPKQTLESAQYGLEISFKQIDSMLPEMRTRLFSKIKMW